MNTEISRRSMLRSLGLVGLAACGAGTLGGLVDHGLAAAQPTTTELDTSTLRRLERATFGVTPALLDEVARMGFPAWVDAQLSAPNSIETPAGIAAAVEASIPDVAAARGADPSERLALRPQIANGVAARFVVNAAFAPDQIRQRLVDVFADLLHVSSGQAPAVLALGDYDLLLRRHALGRYSDLLVATAKSAAMLLYLDNASSRADGDNVPNENYARELLELHTVGVDAGYDEADVVEVAHVLSGWTLDPRTGSFRFVSRRHDLGPVAQGGDVLGWQPTTTGVGAGESLLEHLARHPATGRRVAHLLARRFVGESVTADDPLVDEATALYMANDTAIAPVVGHLLTSDRFDSTATLMARRPTDLVATVLRRGDARIDPAMAGDTTTALTGLLRVMGHLPYEWPSPDGAPTASAAWTNAGAMITRWNALTTFAGATTRGLDLSWDGFGVTTAADAVEVMAGPDIQLV